MIELVLLLQWLGMQALGGSASRAATNVQGDNGDAVTCSEAHGA